MFIDKLTTILLFLELIILIKTDSGFLYILRTIRGL